MGNVKETTGFSAAGFEFQKIAQYHLVIDGTRSFEPVLVFFDEASGMTHVQAFSQFELEYGKNALNNSSPKSVKFLVPVVDSDFIPDSLFDPELQEDYGKFLLDDGIAPLLKLDFPEIGAVLLYREYLPSVKILISHFAGAQRVPFPVFFIKSMQDNMHVYGDRTIGVHVAHDYVAMCIFKEGVLLYYHEFQVNNIDEFNYYLIQVMNMMDTSPANIDLVLSGHTDRDDPFFQRISKYTGKIHFIPTNACVSLVAGIKG